MRREKNALERNVRQIAFIIAFVLGSCSFATLGVNAQQIQNISPTASDNPVPNSSSGGRVHNLALDPNNPTTVYAASEWGGLFRSTDSGQVWRHVSSHETLSTWDVAVSTTGRIFVSSLYDGRTDPETGIQFSDDNGVTWTQPSSIEHPAGACQFVSRQGEISGFGISINPANANNIIVGTNCGIAESADGGNSWAYIDPTPAAAGSNSFYDVVIHNGGIVDICGQQGFFRRPAPTPANPNPVFAAPTAPTIAVPGTPGLPPNAMGLCTIAISPNDPNTVFVATAAGVAESRDGGTTWPTIYPNPDGVGRIVNIATNNRGGLQYDLWLGDINLYRRACQGNPGGGGGANCNLGAAWTNVTTGAHADAGNVLFDTSAVNACPLAYANDGGVDVNSVSGSPACQTPVWAKPAISPQALWVDDLSGIERTAANREGIVIGLQDNGQFISENASDTSQPPNWTAPETGDVPEMDAKPSLLLSTLGSFQSPVNPATGAFVVPPNYLACPPATPTCVCGPPGILCVDNTAATAINACWDIVDPRLPVTDPVNLIPPTVSGVAEAWRDFRFQWKTPVPPLPSTTGFTAGGFAANVVPCSGHPPGLVQRFRGTDTYVTIPTLRSGFAVATSRGIFFTPNITRGAANAWFQLGGNQPANPCDLRVARSRSMTSYYVRGNFGPPRPLRADEPCTARAIGQLFRLTPNAFPINNGNWEVIATANPSVPAGTSAFAAYGVDPSDPDTIIAVDETYNPPQIMMTEDGGTNWRQLTDLERLMTQSGRVKFVVSGAGARPFAADGSGYSQPSIFAFDPEDPNIVVAGGLNSGLFISLDRAQTWQVLSDPTTVSNARPNIGHPLHIHFERDDGAYNIYVGTRGRGVWRITPGLRFVVRLFDFTMASDRHGNAPMLGVSYSTRDGALDRADPANPRLRVVTLNTADRLGSVGQGETIPIPSTFGDYRGVFMPFCEEGEPDYSFLPSRITMALQGHERDRRTTGSDRRTHWTNWDGLFRGMLQRDIRNGSDDTDLASIAGYAWSRFRWGNTDDYIGSAAMVFDRALLMDLATRADNRQEFTINIPSTGIARYRINGAIQVTGLPICR